MDLLYEEEELRQFFSRFKAAFHLRVFHTHVLARKSLDASKFLLFKIYVNKCILKYAEN